MTFKVKDHYYKKAKKENFVARSIYKLEEVDARYKILKKGDRVVDFGYYPGSWVQYASKIVGPTGTVVGLDIQEINSKIASLPNVKLFQKDIFSITDLEQVGVSENFDVLLSDMAPNTTGIRSVDQDRSLELVQSVFEILPKFLKVRGNLVVKVFESDGAQQFLKTQKSRFKAFNYLRPKATRSVSKEFFVIGKDFLA